MEKSWVKRSIVWLKGVRRAGKTSLAQTLDRIEYFDCELPRVRRAWVWLWIEQMREQEPRRVPARFAIGGG